MNRYNCKENETEARQRIEAFWRGETVDRPALLLWASKEPREPVVWNGPELSPYEKDQSVDWQVFRANRRLMTRHFLAEAMPDYTIEYGQWIPQLACLMGGRYEYREGQAWIMEEPDVLEKAPATFDPEHPLARFLADTIAAVGNVMDGRGVLAQVPWMDAFTTLTGLRSPTQLFMDMLLEPEKVRAWTAAATDVLIAAHEYFYQQLQNVGQVETVAWLNLLAPGRMEPLQCDFAMMLSPEHFDEFVYPDLHRQANALDYGIFHLDGKETMRFIAQISRLPNMRVIQYNTEPGDDTFPYAYLHDFRDIRERGLSLYLKCKNVDEAVFLTKELGADGLLLALPKFVSRGEAEQAIQRIKAAAKARC